MRSTARMGWPSARTERACTSPLATTTPWCASTAARPPAGSPSPPGPPAACETGAGTCAKGHALDDAIGVAVSPDGKSVYVVSREWQRRRGAPQPQHNRRGDHPARRDSRLRERDGLGQCADGHGLFEVVVVAVSPDGKSVYVASNPTPAAPWRASTRHDHRGDQQPAGPPAAAARPGRGRAPTAMGSTARRGGGQRGREERLRCLVHGDAVARFIRGTTTGAISQPAGSAGCVSETGAGTCIDGHAFDGANGVAVSPDGKSVYVASNVSNAVARLNRAP